MASHNIFSDTSLGGVLSFLTAPAAVFPEALLGYNSSLAVGGVPASNLQVFLGISGTAGKLALFGSGSSLGDSVVTQTGTGTSSIITTAGSLTVSEFLTFPKRTAPGGDPTKLYLMMTETNTVVFLTPPSDFTAGKNYYPKLSSTGLSWTEGVPDGGGTPTGVGGSGTADILAKWISGTTLGNSLVQCSTSTTTVLSTFAIRPAGADVFAVAETAWQILATVMPDYGATPPSANCRILFWDENTAIKRADAQRTRAWLQVFSQSEVQGLLGSYLPLTGGQLSGRLLISAGDPTFAQKTSTGSSIGYWTGGAAWLLYVGDQSYTYDHAALEYSFVDGTFRVYQYNASLTPPWQGLAVATQQWVTAGFSPISHVHTTVPEILATALGAGAANNTTILYGDRQWRTAPTGGGGAVTSVTVAATSPLQSSGSTINAGNPSGTFTISFPSQNAHAFLVGPASGTTGAVGFRAIDISDILDGALGSGAGSGKVLGIVGSARQWITPTVYVEDVPSAGVWARQPGFWTKINGTSGTLPKWSGVNMVDSPVSEGTDVNGAPIVRVNVKTLWGAETIEANVYLLAQFVLATNSFITYSEDRLHQWLMPLLPNTTDSSRKWVLQGAGSNKFVYVDLPGGGGIQDPTDTTEGYVWVRVRSGGQFVWMRLVGENVWQS